MLPFFLERFIQCVTVHDPWFISSSVLVIPLNEFLSMVVCSHPILLLADVLLIVNILHIRPVTKRFMHLLLIVLFIVETAQNAPHSKGNYLKIYIFPTIMKIKILVL